MTSLVAVPLSTSPVAVPVIVQATFVTTARLFAALRSCRAPRIETALTSRLGRRPDDDRERCACATHQLAKLAGDRVRAGARALSRAHRNEARRFRKGVLNRYERGRIWAGVGRRHCVGQVASDGGGVRHGGHRDSGICGCQRLPGRLPIRRRAVGQLCRYAPTHIHDVHVAVASAETSEGDLHPIRDQAGV